MRNPTALVFFLPLPNQLPLPEESIYTFTSGEGQFTGVPVHQLAGQPRMPDQAGGFVASLRIWHVDVSDASRGGDGDALAQVLSRALPHHVAHGGAPAGEAVDVRGGRRTVVEAVTALGDEPDAESNAFDRCLSSLNDLFQAYRLATGDLVEPITHERLPAAIVYAKRTLIGPPQWDDSLNLLLLHSNVPFERPALDGEAVARVATFLSLQRRSHPFLAYRERSLDARVALETQGDGDLAVLQAEVATEVLLDDLLRLLLWEERVEPAKAARRFQQGFRSRVRHEFASRLGGDWKLDGGGPVAEWGRRIAAVRHRIVHEGYHVTRSDAREALASLDALDAHVRGRLTERRRKYPRTCLLLLGQPGLERLAGWDDQMQRFVQETAQREPDWVATHGDWRRLLDASV